MKKLFTFLALSFIFNGLQAQVSPAALHFDGLSEYVRIPSNFNYGSSNEITVEAWVKVETINPPLQYGPVLCNADAFSGIFLNVIASGAFFTCGNNGVQTSFNFNDGNCHHVAATSSFGALSLYIDGVLKATDSFLGPVGNPGDLFIGKTSPSLSPDYFNGLIKEVRFWGVTRTQAQIQANMNVVLNTATATGLLGYWRCNEITGQTITDYSSVANHATRGSSTAAETADPSFANGCPTCTPPSATITPAGPTTFCSGGSVVLNAPGSVNRSYQWIKGSANIAGATASSYSASAGGNYKVRVTNTVTGCAKITASATPVTVNALPAATITPQGPTTFCAGGSVVLKANSGTGLAYQWRKGANILAGATMLNYTATTGGTYKVIVTNANGCSKISAGQTVTVNCRLSDGTKETNSMVVFPNPTDGNVSIRIISDRNQSCNLIITDAAGREMRCEKREVGEGENFIETNLAGFAKGVYFIKLTGTTENFQQRVVLE